MTFICLFHRIIIWVTMKLMCTFSTSGQNTYTAPLVMLSSCCTLEQMCSPEVRMEEKYVGKRGPTSSIKNGLSHLKPEFQDHT